MPASAASATSMASRAPFSALAAWDSAAARHLLTFSSARTAWPTDFWAFCRIEAAAAPWVSTRMAAVVSWTLSLPARLLAPLAARCSSKRTLSLIHI
eukprot:1566939-Alexandrium_andersonii.AAC.1